MGPEGFREDDIYLRTAVSVEAGGWAHFDYVKMPDYRWGIFLAPPARQVISFGDHIGRPVWNEVPGEMRKALRRMIVTQADTEPASVEQQRLLGQTAPSLYDLRNLFQVNVEEGRHLWAMVYLLHYLASDRFNRSMGVYADTPFGPDGELLTQADFDGHQNEWLPTAGDRALVASLMRPVVEPGRFASWIAPPKNGINHRPIDLEYVKRAEEAP